MFDNLDALAPPKVTDLCLELDCYLSTNIEYVADSLQWWYEHNQIYPCLSRMALDYLSIPGKYQCCLIYISSM